MKNIFHKVDFLKQKLTLFQICRLKRNNGNFVIAGQAHEEHSHEGHAYEDHTYPWWPRSGRPQLNEIWLAKRTEIYASQSTYLYSFLIKFSTFSTIF